MSTFVVGIDLGTSNCALACASLDAAAEQGAAAVEPVLVDQLTAPGQMERLRLLPSVVYLPAGHEDLHGPDGGPVRSVVGAYARSQGSLVPGRLVTSAKSWLCHPTVDRRAAILPPSAPGDVERMSPVEAQSRILAHIRDAWDRSHAGAPLDQQRVVLTVPASFDAIARKLTIEAASACGLGEHLVLFEEPQAAFYDWWAIASRGRKGRRRNRLVLVVDVGGGTTDLTLVDVQWKGAEPALRRLAVGDHILLGGDNMDMAVARMAEQRLDVPGGRLDPARWGMLVQAARMAKETALSGRDDIPSSWRLTVPGRGRKLVGGALCCEVSRGEIEELCLEGFFPRVRPDARPARAVRSGLSQLGLPFEQDVGITRHIAAFLARHCSAGRQPDALLLNGGVFESSLLRDRLLSVVASWVNEEVELLGHGALDLAVARGAAVFGLVQAGIGHRITGGSARAYYAEVAAEQAGGRRGVCLVQRGHEVGEPIVLRERSFDLVVGQPVQLLLHATSSDRDDSPGDIVDLDADDFAPLPPIQTLLHGPGGKARVPVHLSVRLSEVGALELCCVAAAEGDERRWELEFDLRGRLAEWPGAASAAAAVARGLPGPIRARVEEEIGLIYGKAPRSVDDREVRQLPKTLGRVVGTARETWDLPVLREIWSILEPGTKRRRRSPEHEVVFYGLAGYLLRPGLGFPLDQWRVLELFGLFEQDVEYHKEPRVWPAWWTMWRRVAAGLDTGQQRTLLASVGPWLRPELGSPPSRREPRGHDEMLRLVASLERIDPGAKADWGEWLLCGMEAGDTSPLSAWALARIGARVPFSGSVHNVVDPLAATEWVERLVRLPWKRLPDAAFAAAHIGRRTDDRLRDIDGSVRAHAAHRLEQGGHPEWAAMLREVEHLAVEEESRFLGDSLPQGLRL